MASNRLQATTSESKDGEALMQKPRHEENQSKSNEYSGDLRGKCKQIGIHYQ